MSHSEIFLAVLFLTVFVVAVPLVLALVVRRRRPTIVPSLQVCPHCGAHNDTAKTHCYCCGFGFIRPQSDGVDATLIQRVKQADDRQKKRGLQTQAIEGKPLEKTL